jgi:cytochrome oxidase Cu insertion factor (SCO1/SenC/PrrC family)
MNATLSFALALALASGALTSQAGAPRPPAHDYDPPVPGTYALPVIKKAADGEVLDHLGKEQLLHNLVRGRVTVLSFIYSRCGDAKACPYATGVLLELHQLSANDATLAKNMRLVSMSFDPAHDTPQRMADYAKLADHAPTASEWRFITTASQDKLEPILTAYGQAVSVKKNSADPTGPLNHTLRVYLIDAEGAVRNIYSSGTLDVRLVLADVRTLLMKAPDAGKSATD